MASKVAVERLDAIADKFPVDPQNTDSLIETAMTTLGSKMSHLSSLFNKKRSFLLSSLPPSFLLLSHVL